MVSNDKPKDLGFGSDQFCAHYSEILSDFNHFGEVKMTNDLKLQMGHVHVMRQVLKVTKQLKYHPSEPLSVSVDIHVVQRYVLKDFVIRKF